jgi:hypothetical protein
MILILAYKPIKLKSTDNLEIARKNSVEQDREVIFFVEILKNFRNK